MKKSHGTGRQRSAVLLVGERCVALIKRVRAGRTYYLFPGGGVDPGESLAEAAIREAREELGIDVQLENLAARVHFRETKQYYFWARILGGTFGTGTGAELSSSESEESGSYEPVWMPVADLRHIDVRPLCLIPLLLAPPPPGAAPLDCVDE